jgi:hypothetical protein
MHICVKPVVKKKKRKRKTHCSCLRHQIMCHPPLFIYVKIGLRAMENDHHFVNELYGLGGNSTVYRPPPRDIVNDDD